MSNALVFDPFATGALSDPYPTYARLRAESPVHRADGYWVVSRYDDVLRCLRNDDHFSSEQGTGVNVETNPNLINIDPPDHTRLRRLVQRAFVPSRVAALEPIVSELIDEMFLPLLDGGRVDLIDTFAAPLPVAVIARMMGVPRSHQGDFKRWADLAMEGLAGRVSVERQPIVEQGRKEMVRFFKDIVSERRQRAEPGDDLIGVLLAASDEETLSPGEVIAFCCLLLVAGSETTTNLIAATCLAIQEFPRQWQAAIDDRDERRWFLEEMLRYDAPVQAFFRTTTMPVELNGVALEANEKVMLLFGSANRDEQKWKAPTTVDVDRRPTDHLAFGNGVHHCLGAALARVEGIGFLHVLADRVKTLSVDDEPVRTTNPLLRGVHEMPVTINGR
jgi:cytochrome P450